MPHLVVTEKSVSRRVVHNIFWVRMAVRRTGEIEPVPGAFDSLPMRMHKELRDQALSSAVADSTALAYCIQFEQRHQLPVGLGLRCLKLLMWQRLVDFDMNVEKPELLLVGDRTVKPPRSFFQTPAAATQP
jgi:hypothetical protein